MEHDPGRSVQDRGFTDEVAANGGTLIGRGLLAELRRGSVTGKRRGLVATTHVTIPPRGSSAGPAVRWPLPRSEL